MLSTLQKELKKDEEKAVKKNTTQKQPPRGVPRKRYSENMQEIYRRPPMPRCNFSLSCCNFIEIALKHGCSPVNLLHIFRTPLGGCFYITQIAHHSTFHFLRSAHFKYPKCLLKNIQKQ